MITTSFQCDTLPFLCRLTHGPLSKVGGRQVLDTGWILRNASQADRRDQADWHIVWSFSDTPLGSPVLLQRQRRPAVF
jgi:hypothetical protein